MLNSTEPSESGSQTSQNNWSDETFSADATARRRALLKGLGRGAAVLTATVPIQTLAGQICPSSGTMSAQMSQGIAPAANCPSGFSVAFWAETTADNPPAPKNKWPTGASHLAKYRDVFHSSSNNKTMLHIMTDPSYSDEKHWICAWLNSQAVPDFPYRTSRVVDLANPDYRLQYTDSLTFLKKYMESKVG